MKRKGHIIEEIIDYENINRSIDVVLRGKRRKESASGRRILENRDKIIVEISELISTGAFRIGGYTEKKVVDGVKERIVQSVRYKDRIVVNAIMNIVEKHLDKRFIRTTSASIKNRGTTDLFKYIQRDINNDVEGTKYCYKLDINKFYANINQDVMLNCVKRFFKDEKLIGMLENFIRMMPEGLSIGLRSSQCLGNLLLSYYIDHVAKDRLRIKYYYRYCDDVVILSSDKKELWKIRGTIQERLKNIGLTIKENERVFPSVTGIDFLGYVIFPTYAKLRKRNKKNFARKFKKVKSKNRRRELIGSFYGLAKHADCRNLFKNLTGRDMNNFKNLGIKYIPADGKKMFSGNSVSLRQLVNLEIIIRDCEFDVPTKEGTGRCVVSFELNGELSKFFTASKEMISILKQASEGNLFPFKTIISAEIFDRNKTKYSFT